MANSCSFNYGDLLERNAKLYRDAPALVGEFGVISHEMIYERCRQLAGTLQWLGVQSGDRVALLASNGPKVLELLGAAALTGAVLIQINTRATAEEVEFLVSNSGAQYAFFDTAFERLSVGLSDTVSCYSLSDAVGCLKAWPKIDKEVVQDVRVVSAELPLVGMPTAAVEGRPRIALLSHAALLHQALQLSASWSLGGRDRYLCFLPLFHMTGLSFTLAVQLGGGTSVLMESFDAQVAVASMEAWDVTFFATFAPILTSILDAAVAQNTPLPNLRAVIGLEPPEAIARLMRCYPQVRFWNGYGQTETGGLVTLAPAGDRPGSVGCPLSQVALRIAAADGTTAAVGERGEILVRSPSIFSGYSRLPEISAHTARGGWHHTGDLGRIDADGYLWYEGRVPEKALIKSGGENIYPAEVEQALLAHPAVAQARVIGVPDEKWGEAVRALCILHAGAQVQEQELIEFVGTRIARFKRPRDVLFVDSLT